MIEVLIKALPGANPALPRYQSGGAAGADVQAYLEAPLVILPGESRLIPTGFSMAVPPGYEAQIRPRSGLALKHNIGIVNSPGTIDSDYRGEVKVLLTNFGKAPFTVNSGDRIAQMVIAPVDRGKFRFAEQLPPSERGEGGFGHTGI